MRDHAYEVVWFMSKQRGLEVKIREGETFEEFEERMKQIGRRFNYDVVVKRDEEGRYFVWRV